jgi:hypothetical protein
MLGHGIHGGGGGHGDDLGRGVWVSIASEEILRYAQDDTGRGRAKQLRAEQPGKLD